MLRFKPDESAVFFGIEQEGPHRGTPTLFIVGEPPIQGLVSAATRVALEGIAIGQYYFGAGFLSKVSPAYIRTAKRRLDDVFAATPRVYTVETNDPNLLISLGVMSSVLTEFNFVVTLAMEGVLSLEAATLIDLANRSLSALLKIDTQNRTFLFGASRIQTSDYKDYEADRLLFTTDHERSA